jgi:Fe-S cluster assembly protein SufD
MFSFRDITHDTQTTYRLAADEQAVFFLRNRGGDITFELTGPRAEAHIFALFDLALDNQIESTIRQVHLAPQTVSSFTGRSILSDQATCHWKGSLSIAKNASQSSGHQEMRHLLLSSDVKASSFPSLEIETDDVRCGHAATMSAPDPEQLFFLRSRGLSETAATALIAQGFSRDLFEKIQVFGIDFPIPETTHLKKRMRIP